MMNINPIAVGLWIFGGALGYAVGLTHGMAVGLAVTSGISVVASLFAK